MYGEIQFYVDMHFVGRTEIGRTRSCNY